MDSMLPTAVQLPDKDLQQNGFGEVHAHLATLNGKINLIPT